MSIYAIVAIAAFVCLMILGIGSLPMIFRTMCGVVSIIGLSWLIVCGICNLIFWCFGLGFNAKIGTGVFLITMFMLMLFKGSKGE